MPDHQQIYHTKAELYRQLVEREDYQNNLLTAILSIDTLLGKDVIELGAGTGRISCLIAPKANQLVTADISLPMLRIGKRRLAQLSLSNCHFSLGSHWHLPFAADIADIVLSGWSFCYAALDAQGDWHMSLELALEEVRRVLRPGGKLILIESLGTGYEIPHPPDVLVDYLDYLEASNFQSKWIRTDYCFKNMDEAKKLTTFFFGDEPLPMWETSSGVIVPECTGLWWKTLNNPE